MPILTPLLLATTSALAASPTLRPDVFPSELFAKESSPVIFTVKAQTPDPKLSLLQVDASGKKLRYIGIMTDDGVMGDKIKGDGIYTRKISMTEKGAQKFYYSVIDESGSGVPEQVDATRLATVEVLRRPSMLEVLATIWTKIRSHE